MKPVSQSLIQRFFAIEKKIFGRSIEVDVVAGIEQEKGVIEKNLR